MPEFCTLGQIVAATGLDKSTVWRHKSAGHLKHEDTKGARGLRFRLTQVERWLNRWHPTIAAEAMRKLRGQPATVAA